MELDKAIKTITKMSYHNLNEQVIRSLENDVVVVEEPLQIELGWVDVQQPQLSNHGVILTITLRTPGDDEALAMGLLKAEGIIQGLQSIEKVVLPNGHKPNQISICLKQKPLGLDTHLTRRFSSNSSCGFCGKTSLKALEMSSPTLLGRISQPLDPQQLMQLPSQLKAAQKLFKETGGIHGAAIVSSSGELCYVAEDIGRHNALDKVIGQALLDRQAPDDKLLLLSGRASFELIQKAVMGGYAVILSVGAPSSLAINVAQRFDLTLIGFLKQNRFNVYTGDWRLTP